MTAVATPPGAGLLDRVVDARGDLRAIAVMRRLFGVIVILHLLPALTADVVAVERFHVPWWSWLPVPSPVGYRALVWIAAAAGLSMAIGVASRAATVVAFSAVTYLLLVDMTGFAHNRGFLVWMLFGLCLVPARTAWGPLWPLVLMRVVVSTVYLTSGGTKLANPDWRSGLVLFDRFDRYRSEIPFDGWIEEVLTSRTFHHLLSPSAIAIELFIGVGLWFARTRPAAIWLAIAFHAAIEVTASVQTFSYSAIAALALWVTPASHLPWRHPGSGPVRHRPSRGTTVPL